MEIAGRHFFHFIPEFSIAMYEELHKKQLADIKRLLLLVVERKPKISIERFSKWINDHPEENTHEQGGVRKSNAFHLPGELDEAGKKLEATLIDLPLGDYQEFEMLISKAEKFLNLSGKFIEHEQRRKSGLNEIASSSSKKETDSLSNLSWNMYFLNIQADERHKNAELAKSILKTDSKGIANWEMLRDEVVEKYIGTYEFLNNNHVVCFDLKSLNGSKHYHLKIMFNKPDDEIILGTFSCYDKFMLFSCRALLQKIEISSGQPEILSFKRDAQKLKDVPMPIKAFLGLKKHNFQKVPKHADEPISTIKRLDFFTTVTSPFNERENSFLDFAKPILFLATPNPTDDENEGLALNPVIELLDELRLNLANVQVFQNNFKGHSTFYKNSAYDGLRILRRTRFFILVITQKIEKTSFSLVQLGWALAHCKYIAIVYNENYTSTAFDKLEDDLQLKIFKYNGIFEDNIKKIREQIEDYINENMKSFQEESVTIE